MTIRTHAKSVLSICILARSLTRPTLPSAQAGEEPMMGQVYSSDKSFHLPSTTFSGFPQVYDC